MKASVGSTALSPAGAPNHLDLKQRSVRRQAAIGRTRVALARPQANSRGLEDVPLHRLVALAA